MSREIYKPVDNPMTPGQQPGQEAPREAMPSPKHKNAKIIGLEAACASGKTI
jgi:hypothetical protein